MRIRHPLLGLPLVLGLATACAPNADAPPAPSSGLHLRQTDGTWLGHTGDLTFLARRGAVTVGDRFTLETEASPPRVETTAEGAALVLRRDEADERWDARGAAFEQSWLLARRPRNGVRLRVRVQGARHATVDAQGITFVAEADGSAWRYSHATWIDADHTRTFVPARWEDGHIVLEVPDAVVARTAWPAVLDPTLGPESRVDGVRATGLATLYTHGGNRPTGVFVGGNYVLVGAGIRSFGSRNGMVMASRIRPDGTVLDPGSLWIDRAQPVSAHTNTFPRIITNGTGGATVLWWVLSTNAAWAATLSGAGAIGTPVPHERLSFGGGYDDYFDIANDGAQLVSVQVQGAPMGSLTLQRHGPDGTPTPGAPLYTAPTAAWRPVVMPAASGYLVAWQTAPSPEGGEIRYLRVSRAGVALDPPGGVLVSIAAAGRHSVRAATDGTNWLLTWTANAGSGPRLPGVYWALVGADGAIIGSPVNYAGAGTTSAVGFNGTHFLLAWQDGTVVNTARIDRAGTRIDATPTRFDRFGRGPLGVISNGSDYLVFVNSGNLLAQRVSASNILLGDAVRAITLESDNLFHVNCFDGVGYRLAWYRGLMPYVASGIPSGMFTARVSSAGVLLDATPVDLRTIPMMEEGSTSFYLPSHGACSGSSFFAWGSVQATTDGAGAVTSSRQVTEPIRALGSRTQDISFASVTAPYGFLHVGIVSRLGAPQRLVAARLAPNGAHLDPFPIELDTPPDWSNGAATFDGVNHAVVWLRSQSRSMEMRFTRLTTMGDVFNPGGAVLSWPAPAPGISPNALNIALAAGPSQYLVTWSHTRTLENASYYALRLGPTGAVLDRTELLVTHDAVGPITRARGPANQLLVWDGLHYVLAWEHATTHKAMASRITPDGRLLDPAGIVVDPTPGADTDLRISTGGGGRSLVSYTRYDPSLGAMRIFARMFSSADAPVGTDVGLDATSDAAPDVTTDIAADLPRDAAPDITTDIAADLPRDAAPDDATTDVVLTDDTAADAGPAPTDGGSWLCSARRWHTPTSGRVTLMYVVALALARRRRSA